MYIKRGIITVCAAMTALLGLIPTASAQDKGQLVIANYGGSWADVVREAIVKPFERETGIKVIIEASGPTLAKMRAMVNTGKPEWDVVELHGGEMQQMAGEGLLQQINYGGMDKNILAEFPKDALQPYGMGSFQYAKVLAFNTKKVSQGNRPKSWADIWDVKKFPGPRVFDIGNGAFPPIEIVLLADGVPPEKLYPLDFKRAYAALSRLKPNVAKWGSTPAMMAEALVSGETVMAPAYQGRIQQAKDEGASVDYVWDQAVTINYYWTVLKGSRNENNARKFIEFASRPEIQAAVSKSFLAGPLNKKAISLVPVERAKLLPTFPANAARAVTRDSFWWAKKDASGKSNQDINSALWNAWIFQ